jgi:hypothetical protein
MLDGKIRILVLFLCIGTAVPACLLSCADYGRTPGGRPAPLDSLRALFINAPDRLLETVRSKLQPTPAGSEEPAAPEGAHSYDGQPLPVDEAPAARTSGPRYRIKTPEEARVEQLIEATFRSYFRDYRIDGKNLTVRMPFGLNYEREGEPGYSQVFHLDGKGTPEQLWPYIDSVLASDQFTAYADALARPGHKVILFNLERRTYLISRNRDLFEALRQGVYLGTPTRILVHRDDAELTEADVYNYLYAVASVGVDCTGFTFHVHDSIARAYGLDIPSMLGEKWRISPSRVAGRVGLWFYDPANGYTEKLDDRIENLRPADVILFRGSDGGLKHSAVIQSIDWEKGILRYVQCTDWAIESERGAHKSLILFDPSRPEVSLKHYSVIWKQRVRPPFDGEPEPRDWLSDRERYVWYPSAGGSLLVRLRYLAESFQEQEPLFYAHPDPGRSPAFEGTPETLHPLR